jgi:putative oxidoreductase
MATASASAARQSLALIRIGIAALLFVHGVARVYYDAVTPFGGFLDSRGVPFGLGLAWGVTLLELVAAPLLAWGR